MIYDELVDEIGEPDMTLYDSPAVILLDEFTAWIAEEFPDEDPS